LEAGGQLANLIHPTVDLTMTKIGVGLYIQESVILQAHVEVGDNSSIHIATVVGHESKIGSSVFIAHAVSISGRCQIGDGTFVGTNATILPRVKVGQWATIGAGAVVTKDVPDFAVVVGNPGRAIKFNEANEQ
jgi:acetyltransferase-like isoleucine patch superfamily enzyme